MNNQKSHAVRAYAQMVDRLSPKSEMGKGLFRAFWVGGVICMIGQGITEIGKGLWALDKTQAGQLCSVTLIFLSALLTGIGVYDRIGKYAGAGSIVPITGFANSVVSPAMEFRREGLVMGIGAKLFTLSGPVLVYGIGASVVYGLICWIMNWL
jgi:stage V sporulation protein AC